MTTPLRLRNFYDKSPLIKLFVDDNAYALDDTFATLLNDLDMPVPITEQSTTTIKQILDTNNGNMPQVDTIYSNALQLHRNHVPPITDASQLLPMCDKLASPHMVNAILGLNLLNETSTKTRTATIHNTLQCNIITRLTKFGYRPLSKDEFIYNSEDKLTFLRDVKNGLHVAHLNFDNYNGINDIRDALNTCKNITSLSIAPLRSYKSHDTVPQICDPIASSIRTFYAKFPITDNIIMHCKSIEELHVTLQYGEYQLSVKPFAKSLKKLRIDSIANYYHVYENTTEYCIDDSLYDLELCDKLESINISSHILTKLKIHESFLRSLRALNIYTNYNNTDDSPIKCDNIGECTNLRSLSCNCKITTSAFEEVLFPKSLQRLTTCHANDTNLKNCTSITELHPWHRTSSATFTTCKQFARTLMYLNASNIFENNVFANLRDTSLRACRSIISLDVSNNPYITTCDPFAKSLLILKCVGTCGITDNSLSSCKSIIFLDASYNDGITTCGSFAHRIRFLNVYPTQSFNVDTLSDCKSIEYLSINNTSLSRGQSQTPLSFDTFIPATLRCIRVANILQMRVKTYYKCADRQIKLLSSADRTVNNEFDAIRERLYSKV